MQTCQSEGVVSASRVLEARAAAVHPRLASMLQRPPCRCHHRTLPQHPQLVWDGPGLRSQISSSISGSRNEDWYGGSRECGHIGGDVVVCLVAAVRGALPSGTRCDSNGTAGFGVLQAEKPHFSTWQKAGEGVRM